MKKLALTLESNAFFLGCLFGILILISQGCNTTPQVTEFNTISTVELTATAAIDGYYSAVIKGQAPTNQVPEVSKAFNDLQAACTLAAVTSEAGTNALAPAELNTELGALQNLITSIVPTK